MLGSYQITSRVTARAAEERQQTRLAADGRNFSHRFHRVVTSPTYGLELHDSPLSNTGGNALPSSQDLIVRTVMDSTDPGAVDIGRVDRDYLAKVTRIIRPDASMPRLFVRHSEVDGDR
jgi:hypothetical protein